MFNHVFRNFGLPEEMVSDRGPQFISHVWKGLLLTYGSHGELVLGYHPQTNGQTERKNQELGRCLRSYCHNDQHSWSRFLPWAEYAQNSLRQDTTRLTPFKCILGHQPPLFLWTGEPSEVPDLDYWFRARERGTQLTSIFSVLCGGIRPLQIPVTSIPQHSSQGIRCGCPPGICASANRAES